MKGRRKQGTRGLGTGFFPLDMKEAGPVASFEPTDRSVLMSEAAESGRGSEDTQVREGNQAFLGQTHREKR